VPKAAIPAAVLAKLAEGGAGAFVAFVEKQQLAASRRINIPDWIPSVAMIICTSLEQAPKQEVNLKGGAKKKVTLELEPLKIEDRFVLCGPTELELRIQHRNLLFSMTHKARANGKEGIRCRCYERQRAIDGTLMSDTLSKWSHRNRRETCGLVVQLFPAEQKRERVRESGDCHAKTMMNREACVYEDQR
jgi:hypothetical protein